MNKTMKSAATLLVGAFLATASTTALAQQAAANGNGGSTNGGRTLGPGDGTGTQPAPKDGTGYGSPYKRGVSGTTGSGSSCQPGSQVSGARTAARKGR